MVDAIVKIDHDCCWEARGDKHAHQVSTWPMHVSCSQRLTTGRQVEEELEEEITEDEFQDAKTRLVVCSDMWRVR